MVNVYTKYRALYTTYSDCRHDVFGYCKIGLVKKITPDVNDELELKEVLYVIQDIEKEEKEEKYEKERKNSR